MIPWVMLTLVTTAVLFLVGGLIERRTAQRLAESPCPRCNSSLGAESDTGWRRSSTGTPASTRIYRCAKCSVEFEVEDNGAIHKIRR
jgi:hypothetical protein